MSSNYPINLQLEGKKVVVVGGGKVAERKVIGLLGTGAIIKVISPEATDELKRLVSEGKINWRQRAFSVDDLKGAWMIFAATNNRDVNQSIRKSAGDQQLVSIVDDPEGSDFHVPSHFRRGRLSIAISTSGASPMLASNICEGLEQQFDESYEDYLDFLFTTRQRILGEVKDTEIKRKLLAAIVSPQFLNSKDRNADFRELYDEMRAGT